MTDTTLELEMAPDDYTKAMWDKEFLCTFSVDLGDDQLSTKMFVENKGEEAFDFQAALHSYFTTSSLENLEIAGSFEGKEFLNKMVGEGEMQTEDRSVITISEEYDRVYKGVNDPVLNDKGTGKSVSPPWIYFMIIFQVICFQSSTFSLSPLFVNIFAAGGPQHCWMGRYCSVESFWRRGYGFQQFCLC